MTASVRPDQALLSAVVLAGFALIAVATATLAPRTVGALTGLVATVMGFAVTRMVRRPAVGLSTSVALLVFLFVAMTYGRDLGSLVPW